MISDSFTNNFFFERTSARILIVIQALALLLVIGISALAWSTLKIVILIISSIALLFFAYFLLIFRLRFRDLEIIKGK